MSKTTLSERPQPNVDSLSMGVAKLYKDFDDYLLRVKGLAPKSRAKYCFFVGRFLAQYCRAKTPDWSSLRGDDLAAFVHREASRLKRNARASPGTAIRALLRYLIFIGAVRVGLEAAVPRMRRWKHAALPRSLSAKDIDRVVGSVLDGTQQGQRNHAILLLLARTGLRANEVVQLTLDDIDWTSGTLCIRSSKSRRERRLPLTQDVGDALCAYLEYGRPVCSSRAVFLRVSTPVGPLHNSAAVSRIARHALTRAGVVNTPAAAHLFRHSAASRMLGGGASFKEIADVLGHASLETTAIYAKLDLDALSHVSLPWPGSAP